MNTYNLSRNKEAEFNRRVTNITQCLTDKRDSNIHFRLPLWMKQQMKESGRSEADFIIAKLGETMYKPTEYDAEAWAEEVKDL